MLVTLFAGLYGCAGLDSASNQIVGLVTPYKIDIVQGNFVSREQVTALKPGITRAQVRDILGTPLLTSAFHGDRWDYVFTFKRQGAQSQLRKLSVFYKADALERVESEPMPSEAEFVASLDSGRSRGQVPVLQLSEESLKQLPAPPRKPAPAPLPPPPALYPPLEAPGR